jgi:tRNA threonylcarbamoyladenosine biosynthesis protein TsaB
VKLLGIETSSKTASVAVCDDEFILSELNVYANRSHSQILVPLIRQCLENANLSLTDLDGIAVGVGPGSYTGIRIAIATAKGLAFESNLPVCGISTLEGLAYGAFGLARTVISVKSARQNLCYAASFSNGTRISDDRLVDMDELVAEIRSEIPRELNLLPDEMIIFNKLRSKLVNIILENNYIFTGDASETFGKLLNVNHVAPPHLRNEHASFICAAALRKPFIESSNLKASYLEITKAEKDLNLTEKDQ